MLQIRAQLPSPGLDAALEQSDRKLAGRGADRARLRPGPRRPRRRRHAQPRRGAAPRHPRRPLDGTRVRVGAGDRAQRIRRALARRRQPDGPGPRARAVRAAAIVGGRDAAGADDQPQRRADAGAYGRRACSPASSTIARTRPSRRPLTRGRAPGRGQREAIRRPYAGSWMRWRCPPPCGTPCRGPSRPSRTPRPTLFSLRDLMWLGEPGVEPGGAGPLGRDR